MIAVLAHGRIREGCVAAIAEVGCGLPDVPQLVSYLWICRPVRLDCRPDLIRGLALEAGEEVVYVRMGEQVDRRAGGHTGHHTGKVGGRAVRWIGGRGCLRAKHRTGDHASANHATEEHF